MKALVLKTFGGPEAFALSDVPKPAPEAGQVLVRVEATSVNPWTIRSGAVTTRTWCRCPPLPATTSPGSSKPSAPV